jgi:hypothetical protein
VGRPRMRFTWWTAAIVGTALIVTALTSHLHRQKVARAFSGVVVGQDNAVVRAALGKPDRVVSPRPSHWCDSEPVAAQHATDEDRKCKTQWLYSEAPWPSCYSVCFDTAGRVVSKFHYISP